MRLDSTSSNIHEWKFTTSGDPLLKAAIWEEMDVMLQIEDMPRTEARKGKAKVSKPPPTVKEEPNAPRVTKEKSNLLVLLSKDHDRDGGDSIVPRNKGHGNLDDVTTQLRGTSMTASRQSTPIVTYFENSLGADLPTDVEMQDAGDKVLQSHERESLAAAQALQSLSQKETPSTRTLFKASRRNKSPFSRPLTNSARTLAQTTRNTGSTSAARRSSQRHLPPVVPLLRRRLFDQLSAV